MEEGWRRFLEAQEIGPTVSAYARIRQAAHVADSAFGRAAFDGVHDAMTVGGAAHKFLMLMKLLAEKWQARPPLPSSAPPRVVVSGAGPIGLRAGGGVTQTYANVAADL